MNDMLVPVSIIDNGRQRRIEQDLIRLVYADQQFIQAAGAFRNGQENIPVAL